MSAKALRKIIDKINKSNVVNNAATTIGSVSETAHEKLNNIQSLAAVKYNTIVKVCYCWNKRQQIILIK